MTAVSPQLEPEIIERLIAWAEPHDSIAELWLFGSRAKGKARPDSDVDISIVLAEPDGVGNPPFGVYIACGDQWKAELAEIVGRPISFGAMTPNDVMDVEIRSTGMRLWVRG